VACVGCGDDRPKESSLYELLAALDDAVALGCSNAQAEGMAARFRLGTGCSLPAIAQTASLS
jgi:hypothetical protein